MINRWAHGERRVYAKTRAEAQARLGAYAVEVEWVGAFDPDRCAVVADGECVTVQDWGHSVEREMTVSGPVTPW